MIDRGLPMPPLLFSRRRPQQHRSCHSWADVPTSELAWQHSLAPLEEMFDCSCRVKPGSRYPSTAMYCQIVPPPKIDISGNSPLLDLTRSTRVTNFASQPAQCCDLSRATRAKHVQNVHTHTRGVSASSFLPGSQEGPRIRPKIPAPTTGWTAPNTHFSHPHRWFRLPLRSYILSSVGYRICRNRPSNHSIRLCFPEKFESKSRIGAWKPNLCAITS